MHSKWIFWDIIGTVTFPWTLICCLVCCWLVGRSVIKGEKLHFHACILLSLFFLSTLSFLHTLLFLINIFPYLIPPFLPLQPLSVSLIFLCTHTIISSALPRSLVLLVYANSVHMPEMAMHRNEEFYNSWHWDKCFWLITQSGHTKFLLCISNHCVFVYVMHM